MPLATGVRLGPYEIRAALGSGGMGEVYRAYDTRLGREVAVKVLPASVSSDPERLRRFETEARAAGALNHPNVLAVYDVGTHDGAPYIVSELLEGETLRERLQSGAVSLRRAVEHAVQMARGLAAAHEKGIVHRDLKPENVFLTRDGRLKILDFGLAKLRAEGSSGSEVETVSLETRPGVVMGTVGYMSPEQVRGLPADARSDIFALGVVLYEMLSGRPAFRCDTTAETMAAILKEDPPPIASLSPSASALVRIIELCLEKSPDDRLRSAHDLAFALEAVSGLSRSGAKAALTTGSSRRRFFFALATAALVAAVAVASFLVGEARDRPPFSFQRLTFRRGGNMNARFAPDGQTIVYGAAWDGQPLKIFTTRTDSLESRPLDLPDADILAISSSGEMAISLGRSLGKPSHCFGTLARVPLAGGAPREVLESVQGADFSPDGNDLAVIHQVGPRRRLEYPIGKVLYEADFMTYPRVSPQGDLVAFQDDEGLYVVDRAGQKRTLTARRGWGFSLAWSPKGDEVWFANSEAGTQLSLYAVSLSGRRRLVARFPAWVELEDISRDGRILVKLADLRAGIMGLAPGQTQERDLSWLNLSEAQDLSADGQMLLLGESGGGRGSGESTYLRRTDGSSPAVRLGDGLPVALSPDSKWALSRGPGFPSELVLMPTGSGEVKVLKADGIDYLGGAGFSADGKRIFFGGREAGHLRRVYVQDVAGGRPRPITTEGHLSWALSPDSRFVATQQSDGKIMLQPVDGGDARTVPGPPEKGDIGPWRADGRSLFVTEANGAMARIYQRDLATGRRELWREITPADPAGIFDVSPIIAGDGKSYVYTYWRGLSNLYLVEGLR